MLTGCRSRRLLPRSRRTPEPPLPPPALSPDAGAAASSRAVAGRPSHRLLPRARRTPELPPRPRGRRPPGTPIPPPVPAAAARSPATGSCCRNRGPNRRLQPPLIVEGPPTQDTSLRRVSGDVTFSVLRKLQESEGMGTSGSRSGGSGWSPCLLGRLPISWLTCLRHSSSSRR